MLTEQEISLLTKTISILGSNAKMLRSNGEHIAARDTLELCGGVQAIIDRSKAESTAKVAKAQTPSTPGATAVKTEPVTGDKPSV